MKHRIGLRVRFTGYSDQSAGFYKDGLPLKKGETGTVVRHVIDCGATEDDPMHLVWIKSKKPDLYWYEELEPA